VAIRLLSQRLPVLAFVNYYFAGYAPETIRQLLAALGGTAEYEEAITPYVRTPLRARPEADVVSRTGTA
jgi:hypothetical protein